MSRPNVILIVADQMRGDALRADGNECIDTPNLDCLAGKGYRFRCGYSAVPSCLPARASLMSGQAQYQTGVLGMGREQGPIPNDFPHTLAGEFTKAGYRTHLVGKGHFHPQETPMGFESRELDESGRTQMNGFDDDYRAWFKIHAPEGVTPDDHGINWNAWQARPWHTHEYLHPTAWTMTRAIDFLEHTHEDRPFFLNISFARPHSPYTPPAAYWDRYIGEELPDAWQGTWSSMHDKPEEAADTNAWRGKRTDREIHRARAGYYGDVSFIDAQIGRLINNLSRHRVKQFKNTWIIFISDHGDMLGDHHLWRKTYSYEGSTRIPFIICPPEDNIGIESGQVSDAVVELRDIMPTLLEAAGLPVPPTVNGASLFPILQGKADKVRDFLHGEHVTSYSEEQEMHYITTGKRKYIWLPRIGREQFFDLEVDPGECYDLSTSPERQDEMGVFRERLTVTLAERRCGWVEDGRLVNPGDPAWVSPWRDQRWPGPDEILSTTNCACGNEHNSSH